jgi:hypothetical protein
MTFKKFFPGSKKIYIIAGVLLVILSITIPIWRTFKYRLVNKKLNKLVTGKSGGLYQINYHHLLIDEALGNISAENIEILPDSEVYQSMEKTSTAPETLFYIRIPFLQITGVKTPKALLNKEIEAHVIHIVNAEIEFRIGKSGSSKKPDITSYLDGTAYRQLLGKLHAIRTDSIVLENARVTLADRKSKTVWCIATGLSIRFAGTSIDSVSKDDNTRILFSSEMEIHCNQVALPFKSKMYDLQISGLDYKTVSARLHTDEIKLKSRLSESAFASAHKFAKDRIDLVIGSLDLLNISRPEILNQRLIADSLQINAASIHIFRDKSYKHDSVNRTHDFPQEAIMKLPFEAMIKNVLMNDCYIEYKEKNEKSDSSGKLAFFRTYAKLENVTNIPESIARNKYMLLHFRSSFLNTTSFNAVIKMRLNDNMGHFTLDAHLGPIKANALNPLLKPMALAELEHGKINGFVYHFDATNTYGNGQLTFLYEDLSVKLLKKDNDKNKYKTKILPTLAAGLVIKSSNPQNNITRFGNVDYTRDTTRSIFNFMWKSLFSGIKQTVL